MLMEFLVPALTQIPPHVPPPDPPNAYLVVPPLALGTACWLVFAARRMGVNSGFAAYCILTALVAWMGAGIMLTLLEQATDPVITSTPDGGWDVTSMPAAARALLGIASGTLVPLVIALWDRVPWRRWMWGVLAAFPVAYLTAVQVVPPGVDDRLLFLPALAWLTLLPAALCAVLQWSRPAQAPSAPTPSQ